MKAYVITIESLPESVELAERCIQSAKKYGIAVQKHPAFVPSEATDEYMKSRGIPTMNFRERWSRFENCVAAFCSHHSLWEKASREGDTLILEHDAVFNDPIPSTPYDRIVSYGAPSYGKHQLAPQMGMNLLFSKPYLPGAHAYRINKKGAKALLDGVLFNARPTDIYINRDLFPFVQEYYPWPVCADDSVSTIQTVDGCIAKHNKVVPINV